ncbi:hypothetical protein ACTFIN_00130 [Clostridium cagae]|uniref:hypothetical protein n=1 Tax=Clostridium cagae TaxID=2080751 RepID=UPI003F758E14
MNKAEIALELTKLIASDVRLKEKRSVDNNYSKALADAYNEIYNTISISDTNEK